MREQLIFYFGGKSHGSSCRKILRRQGTGKTDDTQRKQDKPHLNNVVLVLVVNAHINDLCHNQRYKQLKGSLQQFEQRCKNTFLSVVLQINQQFFHFRVSPSSSHHIPVYYCTLYCAKQPCNLFRNHINPVILICHADVPAAQPFTQPAGRLIDSPCDRIE